MLGGKVEQRPRRPPARELDWSEIGVSVYHSAAAATTRRAEYLITARVYAIKRSLTASGANFRKT